MNIKKTLKALTVTSCAIVVSSAMTVGTANAADGDSWAGSCQLDNVKFFINLNQFGTQVVGKASLAFGDENSAVRFRVGKQTFFLGKFKRGRPEGISGSVGVNLFEAPRGRGVLRVVAAGRNGSTGRCIMRLSPS